MYKREREKRGRAIKAGMSFNKACSMFVRKTNPQYTAENLMAKLKLASGNILVVVGNGVRVLPDVCSGFA